jgi:hypothetical protein
MQSEIIEKRREVEIQIKEGCVARDQSRVGVDCRSILWEQTCCFRGKVVGNYEEDVKKSIKS